jgi:hypothetical protein
MVLKIVAVFVPANIMDWEIFDIAESVKRSRISNCNGWRDRNRVRRGRMVVKLPYYVIRVIQACCTRLARKGWPQWKHRRQGRTDIQRRDDIVRDEIGRGAVEPRRAGEKRRHIRA